ncbi:MAG TPA: hypothetical protein VIF62_15270 [Labilithrix sp.]|jgi:hypothetical protein
MSSRAPGLALLALVLVAAGCASETSDGAPANEGDAEADIRASCTNPRRYYLVTRGPCATIAGHGGAWTPEADPVFDDAPPSAAASTCVVRWSAPAPPDKQALVDAVGIAGGLAPACGAGASPAMGEVKDAPPPNVILGGSVGCDVCGILHDGHVWVVLPPDRLGRNFLAPLSNGTTRSFAIQPNASPALSIQLPKAPVGTKYVNGVIQIR